MVNPKKVLISQDYGFEATVAGFVIAPVELGTLTVSPAGALVYDGLGVSPTNRAYLGTGTGFKYLLDEDIIENNADYGIDGDKIATRASVRSLVGTEIAAKALTVEAGSQPYLEITGGELKIKALGISSVTVDDTSADLAAGTTANYPNGNELQEGDVLILTAPGGGTQVYMHNGGTAGTAADFTLIDTPINDATIRGAITQGSGLTYNTASGAMGLGGDLTENAIITSNNNKAFVLTTRDDIASTSRQDLSVSPITRRISLDVAESGAGVQSQIRVQESNLSFLYQTGTDETRMYMRSTGVEFEFNGTQTLTYAADYSANFTARSLTDKAYVDSAVSAGVVAGLPNPGQGLTLDDGDLNLGGEIDRDVLFLIDGGAVTFAGIEEGLAIFIDDSKNMLGMGAGEVYDEDDIEDRDIENLRPSLFPYYIGIDGSDPVDGVPATFDDHITIKSNDTSLTFDFDDNPIFTLGAGKTLTYAADYSGTYTARSLVDKAYVDGLVGGSAPAAISETLTGAQANGNTTGNVARSADGLTYTVTHGKDSSKVIAQVRGASTNGVVNAGLTVNAAGTIQVSFGAAPSPGEDYIVVIL